MSARASLPSSEEAGPPRDCPRFFEEQQAIEPPPARGVDPSAVPSRVAVARAEGGGCQSTSGASAAVSCDTSASRDCASGTGRYPEIEGDLADVFGVNVA